MPFEIKKGSEDDYVFVKGNTKYLKEMTEDELAVLAENKDPRVTEKQTAANEPKKLTNKADEPNVSPAK